MTAYRARWVFTGSEEIIENAVVAIENETIIEVTKSGAYDVDLGDVLLLPGLINAHTHLEFSSLQQPLEPRDQFANWINSVIHWRRQQTGSLRSTINLGLTESLQSGVTSLGEIATSDWRTLFEETSLPALPQVVMFREYLGLSDNNVAAQLADARAFLTEQSSVKNVQCGLSPHAPYSVHPALFEGLCKLAEEFNSPLAMHLAESQAELELLRDGTGSLVELFQELGVWKDHAIPQQKRALDYLKRLADLPKVLVVHGNYLDKEEIAFIAQHPQMSVIYCPRTHAAMQPHRHPWQAMIAAGVNVAIGTDSRASNPDLSIWKELKCLHEVHPKIPMSHLLVLATSNAAMALGFEHVGILEEGYQADLCVVRSEPNDFLGKKSSVIRAMKRGKWLGE